jgi:hypothetical protein
LILAIIAAAITGLKVSFSQTYVHDDTTSFNVLNQFLCKYLSNILSLCPLGASAHFSKKLAKSANPLNSFNQVSIASQAALSAHFSALSCA